MGLTIVFFLIYIIIAVVIGIISSRKETEEDFMIAERKVHGVQLAATLSAGFFDGATVGIYFAYIYQYGFSAIWLFIGILIGFLVFRHYSGRIKKRASELGVYTMSEYFYRLLGKRNGLMFSFFLIIQFFLLLIVNLIVSGKILSVIFPIPYYLAVIIGGLIILSYLLLAGFKAVVRTDFFQVAVMFVMCLTVGGVLLGRTALSFSDFNLTQLGAGNIFGFIILTGLGIMVAPDVWQRLLASRDEKALKQGMGYAGIILIVLAVTISVLGLATKQAFPRIQPEDALVTGFSHLLPFGLTTFGMVLLYAVSLSSSDTVTFVISSIITRDLKNFTARFSEQSMRKLTRIFMVLLVLVAIVIGIVYDKIVALGLSLASLNLALFPVVFGSLFWNLKPKAVFWSLVLAFISIVVLFAMNQLTPANAVISFPVGLFSLLMLSKIFKRELQSSSL